MPYVSEGQVVEKRSVWRLSIITDVVWGAVNFVGLLCVRLCCGGGTNGRGRDDRSLLTPACLLRVLRRPPHQLLVALLGA
jgi:hypothetical protein